MGEVLIQHLQHAMDVPYKGEELSIYQQRMIVMMIEIMRITDGDQFTLGFLQGAVRAVEDGNKTLFERARTH